MIRKINIIYSDLDNAINRLQDLKFDLTDIENNNKTRKLNKLLNKFMDHSEKYISKQVLDSWCLRYVYVNPLVIQVQIGFRAKPLNCSLPLIKKFSRF